MAKSKPKYNDTTVNIRLPSDLAHEAKQKAKAQRRPLSEIVRELLRAFLGK
jgi:predicted DNA binding CopG/RHH family protein